MHQSLQLECLQTQNDKESPTHISITKLVLQTKLASVAQGLAHIVLSLLYACLPAPTNLKTQISQQCTCKCNPGLISYKSTQCCLHKAMASDHEAMNTHPMHDSLNKTNFILQSSNEHQQFGHCVNIISVSSYTPFL